jgi:hypothetical protein
MKIAPEKIDAPEAEHSFEDHYYSAKGLRFVKDVRSYRDGNSFLMEESLFFSVKERLG